MSSPYVERIAGAVYDRVLLHGWEPVGNDIAQAYGIPARRVHEVKKAVKSMFGQVGAVWGYDPLLERFVLAPENDCEQRRRVINYAIEHASSAANSIRYQIMGARMSGSVTEDSGHKASAMIDAGAREIGSAAQALVWADEVCPPVNLDDYDLVSG